LIFHVVILARLKDTKSFEGVKMKQYMLLDAHTKTEILRNEPFRLAFRPNRAVIMMMVQHEEANTGRCPRCMKYSSHKEDELIYW
jgi:hypothetical protein